MEISQENKENETKKLINGLNPEEEKKEPLEASPGETEELEKSQKDKRWRAKLYQLNSEGGWDDLGTGYSLVDPSR